VRKQRGKWGSAKAAAGNFFVSSLTLNPIPKPEALRLQPQTHAPSLPHAPCPLHQEPSLRCPSFSFGPRDSFANVCPT
jgi:hypothetical protein